MADLTVAPRFGGAIPATYRARLFPGFSDPDWETFVEHKMVCVGSPEDCYEDVATLDRFGVDTFLGMFQIGGMSFDKAMKSSELFGKEIVPQFLQERAQAR